MANSLRKRILLFPVRLRHLLLLFARTLNAWRQWQRKARQNALARATIIVLLEAELRRMYCPQD